LLKGLKVFDDRQKYLKLDMPHARTQTIDEPLHFTADKLATIFDNLERWETRKRCVLSDFSDPDIDIDLKSDHHQDPKNIEMETLIKHDIPPHSSSSSSSLSSPLSDPIAQDDNHLDPKEDSSSSLLASDTHSIYSPQDIEDIVQRNHTMFVKEVTKQMKVTQKKYADLLRQELERAFGHPLDLHSS